ncbi:S-formylglutathione hydrolase [Ranunculus cassubicifolius]
MAVAEKPTEVSSSKLFGGYIKRYKHHSPVLNCMMHFSIFFPPPPSPSHKFPVIYCFGKLGNTDEDFFLNTEAQRVASIEGVVLVSPDTSPRGLNIDGENDGWDLGLGAGFYVNATQEKWKNYRMYDYVVKELPELLAENFDQLDTSRASLCGFAMGGHGALMIYLKNLDKYKSASAMSPITNPSKVQLCRRAFLNYLGDDISEWEKYDATVLVAKHNSVTFPILLDQGDADEYKDTALLPHTFEEACKKASVPLILRIQPGYDHSYKFVATFIDDHIRHHASALNSNNPQLESTQGSGQRRWGLDLYQYLTRGLRSSPLS